MTTINQLNLKDVNLLQRFYNKTKRETKHYKRGHEYATISEMYCPKSTSKLNPFMLLNITSRKPVKVKFYIKIDEVYIFIFKICLDTKKNGRYMHTFEKDILLSHSYIISDNNCTIQ